MGKLIDLTGQVFGKLTVIDRNWEPRNKKGAFWNCLCECGKSIVYSGYNLKTEITNSCGCDRPPKGVTHGLSYSPEYYIWAGIKDRCRRNPNYTNKGIKICSEWENSFKCFIKDVGRRPSPNHQLDRVNSWGNYEPKNVRWLEGKLNHRNKTTNRVIEFNGESKCLSEWAELLGISRITLSSRLERGWTIEETLTTPVVKDSTKRVAKKKSERQNLPEYKIWHNMKSRCKSSKNYTDKKISFCPEWESFDVFLQYLKDTIGLRPSDEFKFDRINTLGNYEPGNVRWVTHTENMRNTTTNRLITYKNKTQSVAAWAEEIGIAQTTLLRRLDYWSVEDAIERPVNIRKNKSGKSISPNSCTTDYSSNNK